MDKIIIACPLPNDRAKNGIRTRDLNLGKVALYQLSYFRELKCKERLWCKFKNWFYNLQKNRTQDGTWTRTSITAHWILSPACLPIPPLEQKGK